MNTNQTLENVGAAVELIEETEEIPFESAREAVEKMRIKSENLIDSTRREFHKNPLSCLVGAAVFGFALGCLMMSGRRYQTPHQRFIDKSLGQANDLVSSVSDRLSRTASNLKIW